MGLRHPECDSRTLLVLQLTEREQVREEARAGGEYSVTLADRTCCSRAFVL